MVKKVKLDKPVNFIQEAHKKQMDKFKEEDLLQRDLIEMIQKEQYLGAFLMLQEKLRTQAKNSQLVEDKRTETLN